MRRLLALLPLLLALISVLVFIWLEGRVPEPLVPLSLFRMH